MSTLMGLSRSPKHHAMGYPLLPAGGLPGFTHHHPSTNRILASRSRSRMAWHALVAYMVTHLPPPGLSFW
eukprot:5177501-Karenia_brevis.AAC.1